MSADRKFFVSMIGFLAGIFVWEFFDVFFVFVLCAAAVMAVVAVIYLRRVKGVGVGMLLSGIVWVIFGVALGAGRGWLSDVVPDDDVRHLNGRGEIMFDACVSSEVDVRVDKVKYTVTDVCVYLDGGSGGGLSRGLCEEFDGKILLNAGRYPVYEYGDVLRVSGSVEAPEPIEDFSYDKYLARYGIYSVVNDGKIWKAGFGDGGAGGEGGGGGGSGAGGGCGNFFYKWIYKIKNVFERRLGEIFSEPHGSFVAGLLLGARRGIPKDVMDDFNETGLTHIVAISGYNITLVIIVIFGLFGFLSRKGRVVAACVFIAVFVIMVGASSAVVRAGIMGIMGLFAVYFGRKNEVAVAIVISAFLMNLWNPKIIVYDTGFQLSFLATLGLVYVSPKLQVLPGFFGRALSKVPVAFAIRENLIMTLSAQAFALPVILKSFGRFSLVCPLANIFVLPFIPFVMLLGFLSVFFGKVVAFACYVVLDVVFFLIGVFADLSRWL